MSAIQQLTPYMQAYSSEFADDGNVNWLPYTMYFHPFNYRSEVVNTDASGFRYSQHNGIGYSVADHDGVNACHVIAGSSTVFGIGASGDQNSLPSRMSAHTSDATPWINFGARSFNSTQEMILFSLQRHRLPKVKSVVLMSGFNDLGLARLPERLRQEHGAFFMCKDFFDAMGQKKQSRFSKWLGSTKGLDSFGKVPSLDGQIDYAVQLTLRNLANWQAMCVQMGVPLTFVLQPLANWVRETGSVEEEVLFAEREADGGFAEHYGDILTQDSYQTYRDRLAEGAAQLGVSFVDLTSLLKQAVAPDFWLFVDRIHFTDQGHDLVSKLLLDSINAKGPQYENHQSAFQENTLEKNQS